MRVAEALVGARLPGLPVEAACEVLGLVRQLRHAERTPANAILARQLGQLGRVGAAAHLEVPALLSRTPCEPAPAEPSERAARVRDALRIRALLALDWELEAPLARLDGRHAEGTSRVWFRFLGDRLATGPAFHGAIDQPARRQARWLRRVRPTYLSTTPEVLRGLLDAEVSLPEVRAVRVEGAATETDLRRAREALRVPVHLAWTHPVLGPLGATCEQGGLHLDSESVWVDLCAPDGSAAESGEVVVTDLQSEDAPRIRLRSGIFARRAPCACDRGSTCFAIDSVSMTSP